MSIAQYKNVDTPLRTKGIDTTHQHFQMRYTYNFVLAQGAQKLSAKVEMKSLFCYENYTFRNC